MSSGQRARSTAGMAEPDARFDRGRPTIAHVLHQLHLAGAEVLAAGLARRLSDRWRFVFVCLDALGPLADQLAAEGFEVACIERRPGIDGSAGRRLRCQRRLWHVDLLHAHQYTPFFYAALSRRLGRRPPILFTEHGRHYPDVRKVRRVLANRLLLGRRDRVTAVGRFVRQALIDHEGIAARRIDVIHNGIDPARFVVADPAATRAAARHELGLDPRRPVVLQVARFHPVKDHATALAAFAVAARQVPGAALVLVGDGECRPDAESLARGLGLAQSIRFLGVRQDVAALMAGADLFLLSSLSEGISVTLLEAMACRLPIVATDVGGNREVVEDGVSGLLSPRGDAGALGANLVRLLGDGGLRAAMGDAGRRRLLDRFTEAQMHEGYAALYRRMLE